MDEVPQTKESRFIKLSFFILFGIISIICTIYILYNFIKTRSFRRRFQNETLFILVFLVFLNIIFNIPTTLRYYLTKESFNYNKKNKLIFLLK